MQVRRTILRHLIAGGLLLCLAAPGESRGATPAEAAAKVNGLLAQELGSGASAGKAPKVGDEVFLRRVMLDLVGDMPTPEEVTAFALDPAADKRAKMVDKLLADSRYGTNWARFWRDVIFYRRAEDRALVTAPAFVGWCSGELNKGTSWDAMATALITATGNVYEEGRTAIFNAQQARPEETTAEVARIFLGIQVQCAQCHDHPTDRWKREQFHELTAFFPRVALRPTEPQNFQSFAVMSDDVAFRFRPKNNDNRFRGDPEHYMPDKKDASAKGTLMTPKFFLTGQTLPLGKTDKERRETIARWITAKSNPWFAKAYVNRIWAELVGEGFYEPVDDLGPDRKPSAPKTLDYLAAQFAESGYDCKWLFRTICETELYQKQSRPRRTANDAPFAANASQKLRGDQLYTSLLGVLGVDEKSIAARAGAMEGPRAMLRDPRFLFDFVFGYDPSSPRDEVAGSIPQALVLMNAPQINAGLTAKVPTYGLGKLVAAMKDDKGVVVELYMRTLAREPSAGEMKTCLDYVKSVGNRGEAFEDLLWALINSAEFIHRR